MTSLGLVEATSPDPSKEFLEQNICPTRLYEFGKDIPGVFVRHIVGNAAESEIMGCVVSC